MAMGASVIKPDRDYNIANQILASRPILSSISAILALTSKSFHFVVFLLVTYPPCASTAYRQ